MPTDQTLLEWIDARLDSVSGHDWMSGCPDPALAALRVLVEEFSRYNGGKCAYVPLGVEGCEERGTDDGSWCLSCKVRAALDRAESICCGECEP